MVCSWHGKYIVLIEVSDTHAVRLSGSSSRVMGLCCGNLEASWAVHIRILSGGDSQRIRQWQVRMTVFFLIRLTAV